MKQENPLQFESRKKDHVRIAMDPKVQTSDFAGFDRISLVHEALPEINFQDIQVLSPSPFFISSMTAGHEQGQQINLHLAKAAEAQGWMMGVGSQRKELGSGPEASAAAAEWKLLRKSAPKATLFGNLGLAQLIQTPLPELARLIEGLEAAGLFVHTNPLQEALQPEGTPQFAGGERALAEAAAWLGDRYRIPVVLKEVGCGFSKPTLKRIQSLGLFAVDVAGLGGTHWGRVETERLPSRQQRIGETFATWGISTVDSALSYQELKSEGAVSYQLWASGGVRSGLDAAKLLALGSERVGVAQPALQACLQELQTGQEVLIPFMQSWEQELKVAMFCSGCKNLSELRIKGVIKHV